ncbi:MAG: ABC transporter ATP-binding protein [Hyphomicrobiaceae bacterium]
MTAILRCIDVSKHFGAVKAVSNVSFDVEKGALHSVIGPNGAGKTTLFNCITSELAPSGGEVTFEGTRISGRKPHELPPLGIARSFQRTSVFSNLTVAQNVWVSAFPAQIGTKVELLRHADSHPEVADAIQTALAEVGLARYADQPATELAHGDQRLLDFAIALAPRPRLLLLDEPTAGLSRSDTQRVMNLIEGLKGRYTLVLIEHKMDVVMKISDRITVMYFGEVLSEGTPAQIRADAKVREAYLGRRA